MHSNALNMSHQLSFDALNVAAHFCAASAVSVEAPSIARIAFWSVRSSLFQTQEASYDGPD